MPVDYFQPLNSLRSLSGSGFKYKPPTFGVDSTEDTEAVGAPGGTPNIDTGQFHSDPNSNLELASLQDQRLSELKDNAAKGLIMAAPQNTQRELESDIQSNPLTKQGAQVNEYLDKSRAANMSGFSTPMEEAAYSQRMAEEKMRQPAAIEAGKNQTELQKQELANKGALAVTESKGQQAQENLINLRSLLQGGAGNRAISANGVHIGAPSASTNRPVPSALLMNVNKMRDAANKATGFMGYDPFGNKATAQANLKGAIATALSQHPAPPEIKDVAQRIASSSKFGKMPLQQILASGDSSLDLSDATPEEIDHLDDVLKIIRGF